MALFRNETFRYRLLSGAHPIVYKLANPTAVARRQPFA
jgi:hypothetical protein